MQGNFCCIFCVKPVKIEFQQLFQIKYNSTLKNFVWNIVLTVEVYMLTSDPEAATTAFTISHFSSGVSAAEGFFDNQGFSQQAGVNHHRKLCYSHNITILQRLSSLKNPAKSSGFLPSQSKCCSSVFLWKVVLSMKIDMLPRDHRSFSRGLDNALSFHVGCVLVQ